MTLKSRYSSFVQVRLSILTISLLLASSSFKFESSPNVYGKDISKFLFSRRCCRLLSLPNSEGKFYILLSNKLRYFNFKSHSSFGNSDILFVARKSVYSFVNPAKCFTPLILLIFIFKNYNFLKSCERNYTLSISLSDN